MDYVYCTRTVCSCLYFRAKVQRCSCVRKYTCTYGSTSGSTSASYEGSRQGYHMIDYFSTFV
jgi:hypothetical protein